MNKISSLIFLTVCMVMTSACCCGSDRKPQGSVSCKTVGLNAACTVKNLEESKAEICWDMHFTCLNQVVVTGHACEEVGAGSTIVRNMYYKNMTYGHLCDVIESSKVDDVTMRSLEKSAWEKVKKLELPI